MSGVAVTKIFCCTALEPVKGFTVASTSLAEISFHISFFYLQNLEPLGLRTPGGKSHRGEGPVLLQGGTPSLSWGKTIYKFTGWIWLVRHYWITLLIEFSAPGVRCLYASLSAAWVSGSGNAVPFSSALMLSSNEMMIQGLLGLLMIISVSKGRRGRVWAITVGSESAGASHFRQIALQTAKSPCTSLQSPLPGRSSWVD